MSSPALVTDRAVCVGAGEVRALRLLVPQLASPADSVPRECLLHEVISADNPLVQASAFFALCRASRMVLDAVVDTVSGLDVSLEGLRDTGLDTDAAASSHEIKTGFHAHCKRSLDLSARALCGLIVYAHMEAIVLALSGSDPLPIADGRGLLEHFQTTQLVIVGLMNVETLKLLCGIVLILAIEALRFTIEAITIVKDGCIATRYKHRADNIIS